MLERQFNIEQEQASIDNSKLKDIEINEFNLEILDSVIRDFAPELMNIYQFREDETEEQQVRLGQLHEHRILGILLMSHLNRINKLTTAEVEDHYIRFFRDVTRTTISTYLNLLKRASTLYSKRDGRNVYYQFSKEPPMRISPFWFNRIFCIVPIYFNRAIFFSDLYLNADKYLQKHLANNKNIEKSLLINNFKFIVGIILLNIFRNRIIRCSDCQFSKKEKYLRIKKLIELAINERTDVLPGIKLNVFLQKCSEMPMFGGININEEIFKEDILTEILTIINPNITEIEFQIELSARRKELKLNQIEILSNQKV
ncbi:MAG: hypothetical protein ACFE9Z_08700 [Promethearchaeota archaeon]